MFSIWPSLLIVLSINIIIATNLRCNEDINGSFQLIENCRACVIFIAPVVLPTTTMTIITTAKKATILSKNMLESHAEPSSGELVFFDESQDRRRRRRQINVDTVIHQRCARELDGPLYGYDQTHCYCNSNQCNSNIQRCIYEVTSKRHFACYHGTNSSLHSLEIRHKCRSCRIRTEINSIYHYECLTFGEREQKNRTHCTCQRPMCNQDASTCQRFQPTLSRPRTHFVLGTVLNSTILTTTTTKTTTTTTTTTTILTTTSTIEIAILTTTEVATADTMTTTVALAKTTTTVAAVTTTAVTTTTATATTTTATTTTTTTTTMATSTTTITIKTATMTTTTTTKTSGIPTTFTTISSSTSTVTSSSSSTTTSTISTSTTTSTISTSTITTSSTQNSTPSTNTITTTVITTSPLVTTTAITFTLSIVSETEVENSIENSTIIELTPTNEITTQFNEIKHLKTEHIEVKNHATYLSSNFLLICTLFQSFIFLLFTRCDH
ncbi:unnamed protein product [Rotaria magnacalcarata]|uniref:Uncharacterized protein n=2 Tax=Rotaria magnacalcarata TaxID=392030 RepID=A0A816NQ67_9BILA|nr:unnamed protein product [Rotaria magnacalcarata]